MILNPQEEALLTLLRKEFKPYTKVEITCDKMGRPGHYVVSISRKVVLEDR